MTKNAFLKIVLWGIYLIGICCVVYFGYLYLEHSTVIANPDAMLPMMQYEQAAWKLLIGFPFMIASCASIEVIQKSKPLVVRLLILLPALIELALIVSFWFCNVN
jgi:hypothetical protein